MGRYNLSVIVPVYNAEKYIKDTLNSIIVQTVFEEIEVIIINDGSIDKSKEICRYYANKYENIKLYTQKNSGVSAARNKGIEISNGKYVVFLDADDIIESNLYEKMLELIEEKNTDVVVVDFYKNHIEGTVVKYRKEFNDYFEGKNIILYKFFEGVIGGQVVDKIFKRDIVKKVKFDTKYKVGEDMYFMYQYLLLCQNVYIDTNVCGYHYMVRDNSAMTGEFSNKYYDSMLLSKKMYEQIKKNDDFNKSLILKEYALAHWMHETCKAIEYVYRHNAQNMERKKVRQLLNLIRNYKISSAKRYLVKRQFYGIMLMRISPNIYIFFHKIMKIG